ncbi:MAG: Na+/H+ antiporter subunit D [Verrucomicrobiota bacterium]
MIWLLASILVPAVGALFCLMTSSQTRANQAIGVLASLVLLATSTGLFVETLAAGFVSTQSGGWVAPFGITLVVDLFGASMVLITGIVAVAVAIYSLVDIGEDLVRKHYFALFLLLITGVNGAFITGDLFNMYVWFEVMLLSSFVLITLGGTKSQFEGGVKYLVINLLSSILFLGGVGLIYGKLGTLNMAEIALLISESEDAFLINSSAMLLLAAFGVKAAMFPFFFWLPASYHTPKVVISALFAGLLTKVGVYALIRTYTLLFSSQFEVVQTILLFLAGATMVTGVLGAAAQYEIRKILSFHIISQIGYMVMGLAIGSGLALAGAIFYTLHHIIVKTNLFLLGGIIMRRCGTADLKSIGGLYKYAPGLSLLFFIPAFSLGGIPPLSGFWAKFSVIKAGLDESHYILVTVALLVGVLTLYSMTKIWAEAFWKKSPSEREPSEPDAQSSHWSLMGPCVALALITVGIGLWSAPLFELAQNASIQLQQPSMYIEHVLKTYAEEAYASHHP